MYLNSILYSSGYCKEKCIPCHLESWRNFCMSWMCLCDSYPSWSESLARFSDLCRLFLLLKEVVTSDVSMMPSCLFALAVRRSLVRSCIHCGTLHPQPPSSPAGQKALSYLFSSFQVLSLFWLFAWFFCLNFPLLSGSCRKKMLCKTISKILLPRAKPCPWFSFEQLVASVWAWGLHLCLLNDAIKELNCI